MKVQRTGNLAIRRPETRQINLLLVGRDAGFEGSVIRRILSGDRIRIAGRSADLLGALQCLRVKAFDLVMLDCGFHDAELAIFTSDARRQGFEGLILRAAALHSFSFDSLVNLPEPGKTTLLDASQPASATLGVPRPNQTSSISLTARQRVVLECVFEGWSNQRIAQYLTCTEGAVKGTLQQLFQKLGVRNRSQIVRMALEKFLVQGAAPQLPAAAVRREFSVPPLPARSRGKRPIHAGDFVLDIAMHRVWVRGVETHLTPNEFELLTVFVLHPGELLRNTVLLELLWQNPAAKPDSLRVLIRALRTKIETSASPRYIVTERSFGYRFIPSPPR